ncbi:MAG: hypothetical protein V1716_05835 [Candidatus Uhrbacteria bacterium]
MRIGTALRVLVCFDTVEIEVDSSEPLLQDLMALATSVGGGIVDLTILPGCTQEADEIVRVIEANPEKPAKRRRGMEVVTPQAIDADTLTVISGDRRDSINPRHSQVANLWPLVDEISGDLVTIHLPLNEEAKSLLLQVCPTTLDTKA